MQNLKKSPQASWNMLEYFHLVVVDPYIKSPHDWWLMAGWAVPVAALLSGVLADTTAPVLLGSTSQLPKQWKSDGIVLDTRTTTNKNTCTCSVSNVPPKLVPVGTVNIYLDRTPRENQCPTMTHHNNLSIWSPKSSRGREILLFQGNLGW